MTSSSPTPTESLQTIDLHSKIDKGRPKFLEYAYPTPSQLPSSSKPSQYHKMRYRLDPEYRERVKAASREYYHRKKAQQNAQLS